MKIAVCYWGVLRTFRTTFPNHKKNILDILTEYGIEVDIYMHTWKGSLVNKRGNSSQVYSFTTDVSDLVTLTKQTVDDQDEFLSNINLDHYFYKDVYEKFGNCMNGEWLPEMVMYQICSQESQKRVMNMVFTSGVEYDRIILLRPDLEMSIPLAVHSIISITFCAWSMEHLTQHCSYAHDSLHIYKLGISGRGLTEALETLLKS
jgi:hypothetical protein